jgi:hypothetical protein
MFNRPIDSQFSYTDDDLAFIKKVGEWKRGPHYGDVAGRQTNGVTGTSPYDTWREIEIIVQSNTKANDLEKRKEETKKLLMILDINDTPNNRYALECLKNARYPDLNETSQRVTPNVKPIHDWTSHIRTMVEYFAVNHRWDIHEEEPSGFTFNKAAAMLDRKSQSSQYLGNERI